MYSSLLTRKFLTSVLHPSISFISYNALHPVFAWHRAWRNTRAHLSGSAWCVTEDDNRQASWMLLHELSLINRAHNFPQKILAKLRIPAREIPWLIPAKSSKFRGSTRPPIYDWKKWESCSETSAIEGWHCTMLSYQLSNMKSLTNYYITHYANDHTNQLSFLKFRRQKANSAALRLMH